MGYRASGVSWWSLDFYVFQSIAVFYVQTVSSLVSGGPFMLATMSFWCDHSNLLQLLCFQAWQDVPAQGALVSCSGEWNLESTIWEPGVFIVIVIELPSLPVDITRKYPTFRKWKINHELILIFSIWSKNNRILFKFPDFIHVYVYVLSPCTENLGFFLIRLEQTYLFYPVFWF